jgi:hypothetical protein
MTDAPYIADWYRRFADNEAHGQSAIYEGWARGVAADATVLDLLATLPRPKRQPNLIFAVSRLLGAPEGPYREWADWLHERWTDVAAETAQRMTQTNEPRRCASLLPTLAALEGPLALLEVGASAGLCLYPDRYSYRYDDRDQLDPIDGASEVVLECATTGAVPFPVQMPEVVWRAGIDLNPLSVDNDADMHWLETLVWPEQHERRARIRSAIEIARADPPQLVRGDANDRLVELAGSAPADATLVVFHSGVLVYLSAADRERFVETVSALDATWISNEAQGVVPGVQPEGTVAAARFAMAVDGGLAALTGPHGQTLDWF